MTDIFGKDLLAYSEYPPEIEAIGYLHHLLFVLFLDMFHSSTSYVYVHGFICRRWANWNEAWGPWNSSDFAMVKQQTPSSNFKILGWFTSAIFLGLWGGLWLARNNIATQKGDITWYNLRTESWLMRSSQHLYDPQYIKILESVIIHSGNAVLDQPVFHRILLKWCWMITPPSKWGCNGV